MNLTKRVRRREVGFTLIELMIVIVILGILVAIGIVQLIYAEGRAKVAIVKTNMHNTQSVVEIYGVDFAGTYPVSLDGLVNSPDVENAKIILDMENPFSYEIGKGKAWDEELTAVVVPGLVTYEAGADLTRYWVYGYNKFATRVMYRGSEFILSNS